MRLRRRLEDSEEEIVGESSEKPERKTAEQAEL